MKQQAPARQQWSVGGGGDTVAPMAWRRFLGLGRGSVWLAALAVAPMATSTSCSSGRHEFSDNAGSGGTAGATTGGSASAGVGDGGDPTSGGGSANPGTGGGGDCAEADTTPCGPTETVGICHPGTRTCSEGAWGACVGAQEAESRDCTSAMDNDCDGSPDNTIDDACKCTPGDKQACNEHPGLDGNGPCQPGEQACVGDGDSGVWGACVGAVGPEPSDSCAEVGDDSDCDGMENDDCDCTNGETQKCGKCNNGSQTCTNGAWGACTDDLILETPGKGPNLLCISAGTFDMGGDYHGLSEPIHSVTLPAYWMDEKEVTAGQYAACVTAGQCTVPEATHEGCTYATAGKIDHPINCLYQTTAAEFCTWAGKRLPIEEEWEYAARGTDGRTYPWGNAAPTLQARWNTMLYTVAVGTINGGRSPFGLYDMAGNVSEWTASHACDYPVSGLMPASCEDVSQNYYLAYRGGDYSVSAPDGISTYARNMDPFDTPSSRIGFRCAKSL